MESTPAEVTIIKNHPDEILAELRRQSRMPLSDLFYGDDMDAVRRAIVATGKVVREGRELRVSTRPIPGTDDHEILAMAAVSRDPGRSEDYIDTIQDYETSGKTQIQKVEMYRKIYANEGIVNNAINKIAAILSGGGNFKIRRVKKGKRQNAKGDLEEILYQWGRRVNASGLEAVVTGSRGLKAINHQAVRQCLIEGSWIARTVWSAIDLGGKIGSVDLPLVVHSLSTANIEVELADTAGLELYYWAPPRSLLRELRKPKNKDSAKLVKKFIPPDMVAPLKKDGRVLLEPALLIHVKNRGVDDQPFGESMIQAALTAVAYRKALDQLDIVVMQNLINRLTIVMVGSSDPTSPYAKTDVALARQALMQSFFDEPGPNMTIVWAGDDVHVEDVGAHASILSLDSRHNIADGKIKVSLGVPDALLSGTTSDGKSAGWAATIGAAAQLEELQNRQAQIWTTMGERIAIENGFTEVDLVYEFDRGLMVDRVEEVNLALRSYIAGITGIRTTLERIGIDADAEFHRRAKEKGLEPNEDLSWEEVFTPPQGMQGQGPGKDPTDGRPPNDETGKPGPERTTGPTTRENK